jgi:hypothetical protein
VRQRLCAQDAFALQEVWPQGPLLEQQQRPRPRSQSLTPPGSEVRPSTDAPTSSVLSPPSHGNGNTSGGSSAPGSADARQAATRAQPSAAAYMAPQPPSLGSAIRRGLGQYHREDAGSTPKNIDHRTSPFHERQDATAEGGAGAGDDSGARHLRVDAVSTSATAPGAEGQDLQPRSVGNSEAGAQSDSMLAPFPAFLRHTAGEHVATPSLTGGLSTRRPSGDSSAAASPRMYWNGMSFVTREGLLSPAADGAADTEALLALWEAAGVQADQAIARIDALQRAARAEEAGAAGGPSAASSDSAMGGASRGSSIDTVGPAPPRHVWGSALPPQPTPRRLRGTPPQPPGASALSPAGIAARRPPLAPSQRTSRESQDSSGPLAATGFSLRHSPSDSSIATLSRLRGVVPYQLIEQSFMSTGASPAEACGAQRAPLVPAAEYRSPSPTSSRGRQQPQQSE